MCMCVCVSVCMCLYVQGLPLIIENSRLKILYKSEANSGVSKI